MEWFFSVAVGWRLPVKVDNRVALDDSFPCQVVRIEIANKDEAHLKEVTVAPQDVTELENSCFETFY